MPHNSSFLWLSNSSKVHGCPVFCSSPRWTWQFMIMLQPASFIKATVMFTYTQYHFFFFFFFLQYVSCYLSHSVKHQRERETAPQTEWDITAPMVILLDVDCFSDLQRMPTIQIIWIWYVKPNLFDSSEPLTNSLSEVRQKFNRLTLSCLDILIFSLWRPMDNLDFVSF